MASLEWTTSVAMCFFFVFFLNLLDIIIGWVPDSLIDTPKTQLTQIHAEIDISSLLMCWYLSVSQQWEITNLKRLSLLLFSLLVTRAVSAVRLYIFNIHIIRRLDLSYLKLLSSNGRNEPVQQKMLAGSWCVCRCWYDTSLLLFFFFFCAVLEWTPYPCFCPQ